MVDPLADNEVELARQGRNWKKAIVVNTWRRNYFLNSGPQPAQRL